MKQWSRALPRLTLLAILLLGFGLRLYRLGDQPIWWDEGHAVWAARQSLYETTRITAYDVHPPLYLWLLHGWLRLAGESEFAVRYLSLIGGVLTVALVYVVARRLLGRRAALLAALLLSTARFHIWWSQEARMYVWAAFFSLMSVHWFTRLRQGGLRAWWGYVFASAAALYTLYLSALILLIQNLFVVLTVWHHPRRRHVLFTWALSQLGVLLLYAPWLYLAIPRIRHDTARAPFTLAQVWRLFGTVLTTGISTDLDRYTGLLVVFGLIALAGLALLVLDRSQPQRYGFAGWEVGLLLALPLLVPPTVIYGLSIPRGFFYSPKPEARYLLLFAPYLYILLAGTLARLWPKGRWARAMSALALVLVLGAWVGVLPQHYAGRYLRDDMRSALRALAVYAQPDDAVLLVSGDRYPVFLYHYNRAFPDGDGPTVYLMPRHSSLFAAENVDAELAPLHEQHDRLWLASFERSMQDPDNLVESWLDARRASVLNVAQDYNFLRLYTHKSITPLPRTDIQPQYDIAYSAVRGILGYDLPAQEFRPGDVLQAAIYVQAESMPNMNVYLVDPHGQRIDRQTFALPGGVPGRVPLAFRIYEYTAPGRYVLMACAGDVSDVDAGSVDAACVDVPAGRVTLSKRLPKGKPAVAQQVDLGAGRVRFLGYTLSSERVRAGKILTVDLHWQAQTALDRPYTVFAHLLGPYNPATSGPLWAQHDGQPLDGGHPTTRWLPGQMVIDRRVFEIGADTPPGTYQIEIGLYDALTGERLAVAGDEANRILLADIQVIP
ncbi:MAG: glycosyltransferase family 39 protein [Anaerolineae bacterium]|nr:glycosyltransferase family 39 protein [Anaerolineae bacterium]